MVKVLAPQSDSTQDVDTNHGAPSLSAPSLSETAPSTPGNKGPGASSPSVSDDLVNDLVKLFKLLSDETRLRICTF